MRFSIQFDDEVIEILKHTRIASRDTAELREGHQRTNTNQREQRGANKENKARSQQQTSTTATDRAKKKPKKQKKEGKHKTKRPIQ